MAKKIHYDGWLSGAKQGRTLIVGSKVYSSKEDRRKRYTDCIGIDISSGDGVDRVHDMEKAPVSENGCISLFDHVECLSVLEHVQRPWLLAKNIEECMDEGATLFLAVPFVWRFHGYPSDYWRMTHKALELIFPNIDWIKMAYWSGKEVTEVDGAGSSVSPSMLNIGKESNIEIVAVGKKRG